MNATVLPRRYTALLSDAFAVSGSGRGLHFCFDTDLTHTQQRAADLGEPSKPLHATADPRFFFNKSLLKPIVSERTPTRTLTLADDHLWLATL